MSTKLTTGQLREAHVRMQGQAETMRKMAERITKKQMSPLSEAVIMVVEDHIAQLKAENSSLKARIAELETDNLNLIDQLRGQK